MYFRHWLALRKGQKKEGESDKPDKTDSMEVILVICLLKNPLQKKLRVSL